MTELSAPVEALRGIGPRRAAALKKLGVGTLGDLLSRFPRRYEDWRPAARIADLVPGETACAAAMVAAEPVCVRARGGMDLVKVRAVDESGVLDVTFFRQAWMQRALVPGETYLFYGRVEGEGTRRTMAAPAVEREGDREGDIVPVYPLTAGISQAVFRRWVRQALDSVRIPDALPADVRARYGLCGAAEAYGNIHFPADGAALAAARRRLAFEELFFLAVGLKRLRLRRGEVPPLREVDMDPFFHALPFSLTGAQTRCLREALDDMRAGVPMSRLCQGDVGSGKTMVAAGCIYFCVKNGRQAALMAPTEILARQHYETLSALLEPLGVRCALLTGASRGKRRSADRAAVHALDLLIGTHALISASLDFADLGLVVMDEQHRFGVAQRAALAAKGRRPHTLVLSATPIPRTLALILYGDLDLSVLDELPPGRQSVATYAVPGSYRPRIHRFLEKLVRQGRQGYVVCPTVEEGEHGEADGKAEAASVLTCAEDLRRACPGLRVGVVHGRMREKAAVMAAFAAGETDILVCTTVVEVGVDGPNAAVMVVENAEFFGLSQLHQLRGRVGRGTWQSYCILVSDSRNEETRQRLRVLARTADGFQVAEEDLRLRGPGDFLGERQHGLPGLRAADLGLDAALMRDVRTAAEELLARDPALSGCPDAAARVEALLARNENTLN